MTNQDMYGAPPPKKKMHGCLIAALVALALAVPIAGVVMVLGVYGTRKYLAAAKGAEGRSTVSMIARDAAAAYESESMVGGKPVHRLCGSANAVPATVPRGVKYVASSVPGQDYTAGSDAVGWPCLHFSASAPMYFQYQYHAGSGYLATAVAPGPDGFEAAAVGDLNGNGITSLFAMTGVAKDGEVKLSPSIYTENENE